MKRGEARYNDPEARAEYKNAWKRRTYQELRDRLLEDMGPSCALCGSVDRLEFDHPEGRDWDVRAVDRTTRLRIYRREFEVGRLRVLCKPCNQFDWKR